MMKEANDNEEPDTWMPLATANTLLLRNFFPMVLSDAVAPASSEPNEKQKEQSGGDTDASHGNERDAEQHREYVDKRLADLRSFERQASGAAIKRRKT